MGFTVLPLVRAVVVGRLKKLHPARSAEALELVLALLSVTTRVFLVAVAAWLSLRWLNIPEKFDRGVDIAFLVILWFQVGLWAMTLVTRLIHARRDGAVEGAATLNLLRFIGITAVWAVAFLMLLANLGVEIMPLIAGLAIALAVQNVLGDLLASLSIALDKPFKVGDFVVTGEEKGTGEQIVMSNGELLKSRVRNYGLLSERRAELHIRITYETPRALIAEVPGIIEAVTRAQEKTRFERAHFARYGDWALFFEAVYFVQDRVLKVFMDIQQAFNLQLLDEFARRGIQFAYPTSRAVSLQLPVSAGPA